MAAQRFRGPVLPDREARELYVVDGRITYERQAGAETVAEGWIVPGLVDAHCHLGLDDDGAISDEKTERQAIADRDGGALLIRDCGSAADTSWVHDREDLPRLIRAGRHIARTKRYIRNYAHEVEPEELPAYVAQEAQRGDGWVKLVGDWISREEGDLAPSFPPEAFGEAIRVAHEHGAKVTAHCFGHTVLGADRGGDRLHRARHRADRGPRREDGGPVRRAGADGDAAGEVPRLRRGGSGAVPDVRRDHDRPARPASRHAHPKKAKGERVSGNPAKRAQQATPAESPAAAGSALRLGGASGPQGLPADFDPAQLPDLSKYLK